MDTLLRTCSKPFLEMPVLRKLLAPAALLLLLLLAVLLSCLLPPAQAQTWDQSSIINQQWQYQLGQTFVMPTHQVTHQQHLSNNSNSSLLTALDGLVNNMLGQSYLTITIATAYVTELQHMPARWCA